MTMIASTLICCCCCVACLLQLHLAAALALPANATAAAAEQWAVNYVTEAFYGNQATDTNRNLVRDKLQETGLKFSGLSQLSLKQRQLLLKLLFRNYYIKQQVASQRAKIKLSELLGVTNHLSSSSHSAQVLQDAIPKAIIEKVEKWNRRSIRPVYQDSIFIGESKSSSSGKTHWLFRLQPDMSAGKRLRKVTLSIFVSGNSLNMVRGHQVGVQLLQQSRNGSGRVLKSVGQWVAVPAEQQGSEHEINIDVTSATIAAVRELEEARVEAAQRDQLDAAVGSLEISFAIRCNGCQQDVLPDYVAMDAQLVVLRSNRRQRRAAESQSMSWPFDSIDREGSKIFSRRGHDGRLTQTQRCMVASVNSRFESRRCCLMNFNFDLTAYPGVVSPSKLKIHYCTGECHAESPVHAAHSQILTSVANSQNSGLSQEVRDDMSLCCVPAAYRNYKILVLKKSEGSDKPSIALNTIQDISATGCTCA